MRVANSAQLAAWLRDAGLATLAEQTEFDVAESDLNVNLAEVVAQWPGQSPSESTARAVYRILTHARNTPAAMAQPDHPAVPSVVRTLNDACITFNQQLKTFGGRADALAQALTDTNDQLAAHRADSRKHYDQLRADLAQEQEFISEQAEQNFTKLHQQREVHHRHLRYWLIALAALVMLLLGAVVTHAAPEPIDYLPRIQAIFIAHPMAQYGGVEPVNVVLWGNVAPPTLTGSSLNVNCTGGCSGAASFTDNAAFTVGTTGIGVIGGLYDAGADPTLTDGHAARARIDSHSYLLTDCAVGCSGGATTPTDAFTTPTTASLSASFGMTYNGSSWDLMRSGDKNNVTGVVGVLDSAPVARYNATQPTLTDTRYNMLQASSRGELLVTPGVTGFPITGTVTANIAGSISNTTFAATQGTSPWVISFTAPQHAIIDSGTTVVTQPTGTNLHAVLDTTSTTAVTQATGTNLHAVLDTTSTTAVTQATGTNLHAVIDSGTVTANIAGSISNTTFAATQGTSPWVVSNGGTFATQSAITAASGSIASGAVSSGAFASGSVASGAIASGACAVGCIADGGDTTLGTKTDAKSASTDGTSTSVVSILKEISAFAQVPASQGPVTAGTAATASLLTGCVYNPVVAAASTAGQQLATQCDQFGRPLVTDSADTQIIAAINNGIIAQQNYRLRGGPFSTPVGMIADAIKVTPIQTDPCTGAKQFIAISQTANSRYVIGNGHRTYICSVLLVGADAENVSIVEGTGSVCATNTAAVIGGVTAANGPNLAANGGFVEGNGGASVAAVNVNGDDVCVFESASGRVSGNIAVAFGN